MSCKLNNGKAALSTQYIASCLLTKVSRICCLNIRHLGPLHMLSFGVICLWLVKHFDITYRTTAERLWLQYRVIFSKDIEDIVLIARQDRIYLFKTFLFKNNFQ